MAIKIAFCNRKGGSGKTTTAVHVAGALGIKGKRTLLVDCDPQAHASLWLLGEDFRGRCLMDVLTGKDLASQAIYETGIKGLSILPASSTLSGFEAEFIRKKGAAFLLGERLRDAEKEFDYVVFDTPPYIGLLLVSVLTWSRYVFATLPLQFLAVDGLRELDGLVKKVASRANRQLLLKGIIPVMFNRQLRSGWRLLGEIREQFGKEVMYPSIRQNVKLSEAPELHKTAFEYAPKSPGAQDYWHLTKMIESKLEMC